MSRGSKTAVKARSCKWLISTRRWKCPSYARFSPLNPFLPSGMALDLQQLWFISSLPCYVDILQPRGLKKPDHFFVIFEWTASLEADSYQVKGIFSRVVRKYSWSLPATLPASWKNLGNGQCILFSWRHNSLGHSSFWMCCFMWCIYLLPPFTDHLQDIVAVKTCLA